MADDNNAPAAGAEQDDMIAQFSDVTGVPADRARFYLGSANWTLQLALASFYEQDDNNPIDDVINQRMEEDQEEESRHKRTAAAAAAAASAGAAAAGGAAGGSNDLAGGSRMVSFPGGGGAAKKADKKPKYKAQASGARIATIHNMDNSSSEDEDEEQGQAFYTGTERSGQQILGPPRRRNNDEFVQEIFRTAQESGAEVIDPHGDRDGGASGSAAAGGGRGAGRFGGTGYRLGQTVDDHEVRPSASETGASGASGGGRRPQNIEPVVLKLWRQGFSINDGELRPYEEPANKEFLESIMKGEIPAELRQMGGMMVHVDMEDHRHEEFKRTVAKVKPFAGKGHTLGSPAPDVMQSAQPTEAAAAAAAAPSDNPAEDQKAADAQLAVNAEQPTTMIQVRLADGSRLSARFNHTHTVDDIRTYIATARTQYAGQNFALLSSYPSKELADGSATIASAGLLNAALLQRLK